MSRIAERGVAAFAIPHHRAVLADQGVIAHRSQRHDGRDGHHRRVHRRIPRTAAGGFRSTRRCCRRCSTERGYNTYCVGKWHLTPLEESNLAATKRHWPLARGFERFYGFMGGETDQWYPELVYDNHPVAPPALPRGRATTCRRTSRTRRSSSSATRRSSRRTSRGSPTCAPGAGHAPHHVFTEWADRYAGVFDMGYERYREIVLENQKKLGIVPPDTELSPINPYLGRQGPERRSRGRHRTPCGPGTR